MSEEKLLFVFQLHRIRCGLCSLKINELIEPPKLTRVCNAENWILGIINLRGKIITVIDLAMKLGITDAKCEYFSGTIMILNHKDGQIGFWVQSVCGFSSLNEDEIKPPSSSAIGFEAKFLLGVCNSEYGLITILNTEQLLE